MRRNKRKKYGALSVVTALLTALLLPSITAFAKPDWPVDTGIESEAGIVMDMDSEAVLFGQNIHVRKAPASITKLLTALVVLEDKNTKLTDPVTFSATAMNNVDYDSGSKLSLAEGDVLTVEDCLYVMLLQSSNQTSNALAEYVSGSQSAFVDKMNQKAKEIGCGEDTHFANPSGLSDDDQYTTAYDMALISRAAFENPELLKIASTKSYQIPPTKNNPNGAEFEVEHKLVKTQDKNSEYYYPYAIAGKTGRTASAGQTLVTLAEKDGRRLICVTLKSKSFTHYKDTICLLNFGFDRFKDLKVRDHETLISSGEAPLEIDGVSYDRQDLSIDPAGTITVPAKASFTDAVRTVDTKVLPDHPEGAVGRLVYQYGDRTVGSAYIISKKKVQQEESSLHEKDAGGDAGKPGANSGETPGGQSAAGLIGAVAAVILAAGALIGGLTFLFLKGRKAEQRRQQERRRKRLERLKDVGCTEREFNKLLEERLNRRH